MSQFRTVGRHAAFIAAIVVLAFGIPGLHAATNSVDGQGQVGAAPVCVFAVSQTGPIDGESTDCTRSQGVITHGWDGFYYSHEIKSPRDSASGQATGKRQHKPITIRKEIDKATPLLFKASLTNEILPTVEIEFLRHGAGVPPTVYFKVKLTNAFISSISEFMPDTRGEPSAAPVNPSEDISFSYQKIEWTSFAADGSQINRAGWDLAKNKGA